MLLLFSFACLWKIFDGKNGFALLYNIEFKCSRHLCAEAEGATDEF